MRKLFEDAERDEKELGPGSELHVIIFDEIDAICKARGSVQSGGGDRRKHAVTESDGAAVPLMRSCVPQTDARSTLAGVHDTLVNQLLTKIDGVDSLNNILLIGMTNRKVRSSVSTVVRIKAVASVCMTQRAAVI